MRATLFLVFAIFATCFSSCSSGGGKTGTCVPNPDSASVAFDSLNYTPLLSDTDGKMDSIFRSKGYIFGQDIIDASHDGNLDASFLLAQMYSYGIAGSVPNRRMAFQLYISLADNGVTEAKAMAGYMLLYGYGVEADASKGLDLVTEAANNGSGLAYLFMGNFYAQAEPTPKNISLAKACYAEAQALGITEAAAILKNFDK